MTKTSKPIVFFGTEDFSLGALKALVESGLNVIAVVTKPDSPQGRGHKLTPPVVKTYAIEHNIRVLQPQKVSEINDEVAKLDNPAGVLVSYGKIIPQSTLDLFTPGIINVHPSLLPKYRGPSPIETAILNGDEETGVSIMQLSKDMDAGPIYAQRSYEMSEVELAHSLYTELGSIGSKLLIETLPSIFEETLLPLPQDDSKATYCHIIKKSDGVIDWNESAERIEREVRAYQRWPQSRTTLGSIEVILTNTVAVWHDHNLSPGELKIPSHNDARVILVGTGDGEIQIHTLKPLGKKEMPVSAFLSGYRSQLGI